MVTTCLAQSSSLSAQSNDTLPVRVQARLAMKIVVLGAVIGFFFLLAGCQVAPPLPLVGNPFAPADPPRPAVGDTYVYQLSDGYGNQSKLGQISYRIDKIDADRTVVSVTPGTPRAGIARTEIYSNDGNWLRHPLVNHYALVDYEFAPAFPAYVFPLEPGKSWSMRVDAANPEKGRRSVRVDGGVLGAERVRVPAGEFDTIKIRRDVYPGDHPAETHITEIDWYAPALGRTVRMVSDSMWTDGSCDEMSCTPDYRGEWTIYELVAYPPPAR